MRSLCHAWSWRIGRLGPARQRPWRAAGVALALLLLPGLLAAQDDPGRQEVRSLRFEGATSFPHALLRAAIVTQESGCRLPLPLSLVTCSFGLAQDRRFLDPTVLGYDAIRLRLFYFQRGYRKAGVQVDTIPQPDGGVHVVFRVDEGQPVRVSAIELAGTADLLPDDIAERLPLRVGDPFSQLAFEAARDSLISALRNRGYPRADVLVNYDIPPDRPLEARLRFDVFPGTQARFGDIVIEGNKNVSNTVVRRMLTFRTGNLYREEELLRSQSKLFALEAFSHASILPQMDAGADSVIPVTVRVNEGDLHRFRLGAGINTADCVNAEGRWTSRNFLGGARRLEVRGAVSNVFADRLGSFPCVETGDSIYGELNSSLAADFVQPWFFSRNTSLGAGIFIERVSLPDVFVRDARGGYLTLNRLVSSRATLSLGFRPELTKLRASGDLIFCVSFNACATDDDVHVLSQPHWLAPITLAYTVDRSNSLFTPTSGHILRLEAETATGATGSDFEYVRLVGDLSAYRQVTDGVVLASRIRPGWARPLDRHEGLGINPQKRFFAGGANSVRGFAQYRLGPKVLFVPAERLRPDPAGGWAGCSDAEINAGTCDPSGLVTADPGAFDPRPVGGAVLVEGNLEARIPLFQDKWRAAAFVDFGQVWRTAGEARLSDLEVTPGLGVRYYSPIGPIRVDVGYNMQGKETLPVLTTRVDNSQKLQPLGEVTWNPRRSLFDRLQIHFSIGQAF